MATALMYISFPNAFLLIFSGLEDDILQGYCPV
jgi:hypothetical protein